jgi:hypothetical protein
MSKFIVGDYFRKFAGGDQNGPSMPRGGESAVFGIEVFAVDAGATIDFRVEHKNIEDTTWVNLVTLATLGAGISTANASAIKEQIRFVFVVNGTNNYSSVYANVLAPMWRPY